MDTLGKDEVESIVFSIELIRFVLCWGGVNRINMLVA